jgi:hypothetical protein
MPLQSRPPAMRAAADMTSSRCGDDLEIRLSRWSPPESVCVFVGMKQQNRWAIHLNGFQEIQFQRPDNKRQDYLSAL